jgi:uncharacterized protein YebE (UPF0316 family)
MWDAVLSGLLIFSLRIVDISLYTMRIMMVVRGRKGLAWLFALCQSFVFVYAIREVLTGINNLYNVIGYSAGFATGLVLGMIIEGKLAIGYTHLRIISPGMGAALCEALREHGFGVTEIAGRGRDGAVTVLSCSVLRKDAPRVINLVTAVDSQAFITAENVRSMQKGFW